MYDLAIGAAFVFFLLAPAVAATMFGVKGEASEA